MSVSVVPSSLRDFATGSASALNLGIYAPTSSLDGLRCVLAVSVIQDLSLLTADVSVAFTNAPVEEGVVDLVLLPGNMTINGQHPSFVSAFLLLDFIGHIFWTRDSVRTDHAIYPYEGSVLFFIKGSLEAKLPTIWRDGNGTARKKLGRGESEQGEDGEDKIWRKPEERRCRCAKR